jgi:hypothetical protein
VVDYEGSDTPSTPEFKLQDLTLWCLVKEIFLCVGDVAVDIKTRLVTSSISISDGSIF